jgi:tungstate transport system substrate-binding protein
MKLGHRALFGMIVLALMVTLIPAGIISAEAEGTDYTVVSGDTLWGLSRDYLGAGSKYLEIVEATNGMGEGYAFIENPDLIAVGWVLRIPGTEITVSTGETQRLVLATTTSTADSGLLDAILPDFESKFNTDVEVIAVGTGQALATGEAGDCDVVLVHARSREDAFVDAGHGVNRTDVMYNDFIIIGPADNPAGITEMTDAAAAFAQIAEAQAPFVSRGDDSGTHTKEKAIWSAAGIEPSGDWYISAGQGMGAVLTMANEQLAYTMSDRGTYLARTLEGIELEILVEGDSIMFNPYGVIAVNPEQHPAVSYDLAMSFIDWLTSVETQAVIGEYGKDKLGLPLFYPDSEQWRADNP